MKKYFIFAFAALTSVVMFSCKEKPGGGGETPENPTTSGKVVLSAHELEITVGAQEKLRASVNPVKEGVAISYKSDDETVATVDASGLVTAVESGKANIIASAEGYTSDTCVVTVRSVFSAYSIEDYGVFGQKPTEYVEGSDTIMKLSFLNNQEYNCRIAYWPVLIWDGDVTYVHGTGWAGQGFLIYAEVPFYTIYDANAGEDYNEIPFSWGTFYITDLEGADKVYRNHAQGGKLLDRDAYAEYMESYFDFAANGASGDDIKFDLLNKAITGVTIFMADYTEAEPVWYMDYGLNSGLVRNLEIKYTGTEDTESFTYEGDIDWFSIDEDRYWGLKINETGDALVKPYDLSIISEHYAAETTIQQAPAKKEPQIIHKWYKETLQRPNIVRRGDNTKFRMAR